MPWSDDLYTAMLVQRYCEGSCTAEERMAIEANPDLLAQVAMMRHEDVGLGKLFSDAAGERPIPDDRPSSQDLIAYVDGTLDEVRRQFVEECAERMPEIREEIRLLRRLGRNPLTSE